MSSSLQHINQLLVEAQNASLYQELITQLNKDFNLSGMSISIPSGISSNELKEQLFAIVAHLINTHFEGFLNLLYRIDLPESKIKNLPKTNFDDYIAQVSFLILKREWMKVWYRKKYL